MPWNILIDRANGDKHVVPDFGRKHDLSLDCWCIPKRSDNVDMVIIHWSHESVAKLPAPPTDRRTPEGE